MDKHYDSEMTQSGFTLALNFIRFAVTYLLSAGVYTYGESHQISIQDAFSKIETIAGNGNLASNSGKGDGGYATNASFGILTGLLLNSDGEIFIGDSTFGVVRRVDTYGIVTTVIGTGIPGNNGDQHSALYTQIKYITGMAFDPQGLFFYSDIGNAVIRRLDHDSIIKTVANIYGGYFAQLSKDVIIVPTSVENRLEYRNISDGSGGIFAGTGSIGFGGDGGFATNAILNDPISVIKDRHGRIIFSDRLNHKIRIIDSNSVISTLIGNTNITNSGSFFGKFNGDGLDALSTSLNCPTGLLLDSQGRLFFCDSKNHRVRRLESNGTVSTVVGNGIASYGGNNGYSTNAQLNGPTVIAWDLMGNLLIADSQNYAVRKATFFYKVNIPATPNAKISIKPESTYYLPGSQIQISIEPAPGYEFLSWDDGLKKTQRSVVITNSVLMQFTIAESPKESSALVIEKKNPQTLVLGLTGNTNENYIIDTSNNLKEWVPYVTNNTDSSGIFSLELFGLTDSKKYFRSRKLLVPPPVSSLATITLNNYDKNIPLNYFTVNSLLPVGYYLQLLGGPLGGPLFPIYLASNPLQTVFSLTTEGFFDVGIGIVPGVEGGSIAQLQLRVWKDGATYESAALKGDAIAFQQITGAWNSEAIPPIPPMGPSLNLPNPTIINLKNVTNGPIYELKLTNFVWIPPGTFLMGSPSYDDNGTTYGSPQTQVTLTSGFWMSKYLVTQEQYLAIMGVNPSYNKGEKNLPVEMVTWQDAMNFCHKFTAQEKSAGRLPSGYVFRLPTDAEWEYACRAGTTSRFYYGEDPTYSFLTNYAWYVENSNNKTHPVGQLLPNPWGLYDINGNVHQWCWDYFNYNLPGGAKINPTGPNYGSVKVIRGGGFLNTRNHCRSGQRNAWPQDGRLRDIGFRPVLAPAL